VPRCIARSSRVALHLDHRAFPETDFLSDFGGSLTIGLRAVNQFIEGPRCRTGYRRVSSKYDETACVIAENW
jgi:hypothetical protein